MYSMIFSIAFLVFALLSIGIGLIKGHKYVWTYSALKLGALLLAAGISAALSVALANVAFRGLHSLLLSESVLGEASLSLQQVSSVVEAAGALMAMIGAPVLFFALFLTLRAILNAIAVRVCVAVSGDSAKAGSEKGKKKRMKSIRSKGANPLGMVLGSVCGLLFCVIVLIPAVGTCTVTNRVMHTMSALTSSYTMDELSEVTEEIDESIGAHTVRTLGGNMMYSYLTTYTVNGERVNLLTETQFLMSLGDVVAAVQNPDVKSTEAAEAVLEAKECFTETTLLPTVLPEVLRVAAEQWENGGNFCGMKEPSFGNGLESLRDETVVMLTTSDSDTIRRDVETVAQILAVMVEQDALKNMKSDPLGVLDNQALTSSIVYEVLSNEHLCPLVGSASEAGIQILGEKLDADMSDIHLDMMAVTDKHAEAEAIAKMLGDAHLMLEYMNGHSAVDAETMRSFGVLLDDLAHMQMAGRESTDQVLEHLLCSEKVYSKLGFTAEESAKLVNTINTQAHSGGYSPLMQSLGQTVEVIQLSTKEQKDTAEMDAKVEVLLQDLTPESAEVLKEIASPTIVQNHGVPEKSAQPAADMLSNMFGNLSDAKDSGMSEEEVGGQAVLGRQHHFSTPWLTERHGYDPTSRRARSPRRICFPTCLETCRTRRIAA